MTKPLSMTIEEIAETVASAVARATKGLREASDAITEFREAEMTLKGLAASRATAVEIQKSSDGDDPRLAYSIPELAQKLGYHRKTIERMIDAGKLTAIRPFNGNRRVTAASVKALFDPQEMKTP